MGQNRRRGGAAWKLFVIVGLLAMLVFFIARSGKFNQAYEALAGVTPAPTLAPPPLNFQQLAPMYRYGSVGPEVVALQQRLAQLGYYTSDIDGQYYQGTQAAVKAFQLQHGLDADGIAGELTLQALNSPNAQPYVPPSASPQPSSMPEGSYTSPAP